MVDVANKTAASNGMSVGFSKVDEWVEYTVDVSAGTYNIDFRYFCGSTTPGDLEVSLDGEVLTTITEILNQGSYQTPQGKGQQV